MGYPRFGMLDLLKLLTGLLVGLFRSHAAREAETAFLRQQLVVLKAVGASEAQAAHCRSPDLRLALNSVSTSPSRRSPSTCHGVAAHALQLAGFPAQSHRPHRRHRSVRRADDRVQTALRAGHPASGAATARLDQCDSKSNRRVGIAQQISEAFPWDEAPRYLVRDRDTSYGAAVTPRL